jgi:hypothetical protein
MTNLRHGHDALDRDGHLEAAGHRNSASADADSASVDGGIRANGAVGQRERPTIFDAAVVVALNALASLHRAGP